MALPYRADSPRATQSLRIRPKRRSTVRRLHPSLLAASALPYPSIFSNASRRMSSSGRSARSRSDSSETSAANSAVGSLPIMSLIPGPSFLPPAGGPGGRNPQFKSLRRRSQLVDDGRRCCRGYRWFGLGRSCHLFGNRASWFADHRPVDDGGCLLRFRGMDEQIARIQSNLSRPLCQSRFLDRHCSTNSRNCRAGVGGM